MMAEMPDIWKDDTRMAVLFAPFRDKSLNPTSWNQKLKFWTDLILENVKQTEDLIIDTKLLSSRFERKGKIPSCFPTVLDEMKRSNLITELSVEPKINNLSPSKGWLSWGYQKFVHSPVSWSLKFLKSADSANAGRKFVVVHMLKEKCKKLIERHYCEAVCDITDSVVEFSKLLDANKDICKSDLEFYLIIEQLVKEKKVIVHQENSVVFVKFCSRTDSEVKPVRDSDIQILKIKTASQSLLSRIETLTMEIDRLTNEAKDFKKKNMITQALRCLRERKRKQKQIEKLSGSFDLLDDILSRLRNAVSDEMVMKAIETGTSALKEYTSKIGIDQVNTTLDNLAEVMEQQNEMDAELSMMSSQEGNVSTDDLESELDDLISEGSKQSVSADQPADTLSGFHLPDQLSTKNETTADNKNVDMCLPDVPTFSPSKSPKGDRRNIVSIGDLAS